MFSPTDIPEPVRLAYLCRELDRLHLDPGNHDDAAHEAFMQAAPSRRDRAERRAAIARLLVSLGPAVKWSERVRLVHDKFGKQGASKPRLKAILTAVQGVDPINFAPALLDDYNGKTTKAEITPDAWRFFLTTIRDAAPEFPLIQAWRDTRDVGRKHGWDVPSYPTVFRRWQGLTQAQRDAARHGRAEAAKRLAIPAARDKTSINALE
jgi:putative transposase